MDSLEGKQEVRVNGPAKNSAPHPGESVPALEVKPPSQLPTQLQSVRKPLAQRVPAWKPQEAGKCVSLRKLEARRKGCGAWLKIELIRWIKVLGRMLSLPTGGWGESLSRGTLATGWISRKIGGNDGAKARGVRAGRVLEECWGAGWDSTARAESQRICWGRTVPKARRCQVCGGKEALGPSFPPFQNCGIPHLFGYYLFKPFKKKKRSTEKVSWESPTSNILWQSPSEISQLKIADESLDLSQAPAAPSSEQERLPTPPLFSPVPQNPSRDERFFYSLIPTYLLESTHTPVTNTKMRPPELCSVLINSVFIYSYSNFSQVGKALSVRSNSIS